MLGDVLHGVVYVQEKWEGIGGDGQGSQRRVQMFPMVFKGTRELMRSHKRAGPCKQVQFLYISN